MSTLGSQIQLEVRRSLRIPCQVRAYMHSWMSACVLKRESALFFCPCWHYSYLARVCVCVHASICVCWCFCIESAVCSRTGIWCHQHSDVSTQRQTKPNPNPLPATHNPTGNCGGPRPGGLLPLTHTRTHMLVQAFPHTDTQKLTRMHLCFQVSRHTHAIRTYMVYWCNSNSTQKFNCFSPIMCRWDLESKITKTAHNQSVCLFIYTGLIQDYWDYAHAPTSSCKTN